MKRRVLSSWVRINSVKFYAVSAWPQPTLYFPSKAKKIIEKTFITTRNNILQHWWRFDNKPSSFDCHCFYVFQSRTFCSRLWKWSVAILEIPERTVMIFILGKECDKKSTFQLLWQQTAVFYATLHLKFGCMRGGICCFIFSFTVKIIT